jgi:serine/threonine-protein kinase RsbW
LTMKQIKELKISSLQSNISLVEKFIEEVCADNYIFHNYFGNIMLAIEEAVKNAIIHGNRLDSSKQVILTYQRRREGLCFTIQDEGEGFNPQDIPNPIESDDARGNGVFLIRSLADKVSYNQIGNQVELIFTISSINQETTLNRISHLKRYFNRQKSFV